MNSFEHRNPSDKVSASAQSTRHPRFNTEENERVEYCEMFLRFVMLTCLLCTLAICLSHLTTPAQVPGAGDAAFASDAAATPATVTARKTTTAPAATVRITLPAGFHF